MYALAWHEGGGAAALKSRFQAKSSIIFIENGRQFALLTIRAHKKQWNVKGIYSLAKQQKRRFMAHMLNSEHRKCRAAALYVLWSLAHWSIFVHILIFSLVEIHQERIFIRQFFSQLLVFWTKTFWKDQCVSSQNEQREAKMQKRELFVAKWWWMGFSKNDIFFMHTCDQMHCSCCLLWKIQTKKLSNFWANLSWQRPLI